MMDSSNDQTIVDKAVLSPIKKNKRGEVCVMKYNYSY